MDAFIEMLRSWHNFYFMMGGAAVTLLGLMFVAISLGLPYITEDNREDIKTFANPSIFYFVAGLILAALMLMPENNPLLLAGTLLILGLFAASRITPFALRLFRAALKYQDFDLQEWLFQIVFPMLSCLLILMSAALFYLNQWHFAFLSLWFVMILLLLSAISNTWSLVLWIIHQKRDENAARANSAD